MREKQHPNIRITRSLVESYLWAIDQNYPLLQHWKKLQPSNSKHNRPLKTKPNQVRTKANPSSRILKEINTKKLELRRLQQRLNILHSITYRLKRRITKKNEFSARKSSHWWNHKTRRKMVKGSIGRTRTKRSFTSVVMIPWKYTMISKSQKGKLEF